MERATLKLASSPVTTACAAAISCHSTRSGPPPAAPAARRLCSPRVTPTTAASARPRPHPQRRAPAEPPRLTTCCGQPRRRAQGGHPLGRAQPRRQPRSRCATSATSHQTAVGTAPPAAPSSECAGSRRGVEALAVRIAAIIDERRRPHNSAPSTSLPLPRPLTPRPYFPRHHAARPGGRRSQPVTSPRPHPASCAAAVSHATCPSGPRWCAR